jgi:hypothetical protein
VEVFLLYHINELNDEDSKLIGVYSSQENAEKARQKTMALPGFINSPNSFLIDKCKLDEDHWQEGFVTVK